jgi:hypothetical protein
LREVSEIDPEFGEAAGMLSEVGIDVESADFPPFSDPLATQGFWMGKKIPWERRIEHAGKMRLRE